MDRGVTDIATATSPEYGLVHNEHGKRAAQKLTRCQRMVARRRPAEKKPASNGCKKAERQVAKVHRKVARQRQDAARKRAKKVVRDHDSSAVEGFNPKFLAKSTMARQAADAALAATRTALIGMGRRQQRTVYPVRPACTTMGCGYCGARAKHRLPLSERTYTCTACGAVCPRDRNSARVMLVRAGLDPDGVEGVRPDLPQGE
ncbi:RNA-guided endonuclease TnpB family protein [Nocardiopsis kunsanensis]|uniref:RNA-guided endonuclease TnpB family protein n=1 Tax=Nocardiopsis kunsanensis TaxID=141693 RepID=UPI001360B4E7|nr:RNA-guided endonuclease TnpB family protein [Nocardiopsis kunsanensis]